MGTFEGKTAIITGGGSGIGRALGEEMAAHGAFVVLADVDIEPAEEAATAIHDRGGRATAAALDVTDAAAVETLVGRIANDHGTLDYMFNNAGIAIAKEARDHTLEDWYTTLDVDLRGVVHGVHAAYPRMIEQGGGHIVNTASLAGLIPAVNEVAYAAAKHGVVGLSTTLRAEGADLGVKVSVVCPGFIDTPILFEHMRPEVAERWGFHSREDAKAAIPFKAMPVDQAAREILKGVRRNQAIIAVTPHAKMLWNLYRASPAAAVRIGTRIIRDFRKRYSNA
jgi:NAD(P)-dependent dehydrogenase (short-subunit alcohol dehydrogenase family)